MRPLLDIRFKLGNLAMILLSKSSFLEALQGEYMQDGPCIAGVVVVSESILQSDSKESSSKSVNQHREESTPSSPHHKILLPPFSTFKRIVLHFSS